MKYVYMLEHRRKIKGNATDTKRIGYYSTLEKANSTLEYYKSITGFKDYPKDFVIKKIRIDFDNFDFE